MHYWRKRSKSGVAFERSLESFDQMGLGSCNTKGVNSTSPQITVGPHTAIISLYRDSLYENLYVIPIHKI